MRTSVSLQGRHEAVQGGNHMIRLFCVSVINDIKDDVNLPKVSLNNLMSI